MADPISPFTPEMSQQLQQLLQIQTDRAQSTTPIHQAAMAMAQHMAPGYAQSAMTAPSSLPPVGGGGGITPSGTSGGPGAGTAAMAALVGALLKAAGGSGGGGNLGALGNALKKLFQRGGPGVQNNQPFPGGALPSGNPGMNNFGGWDGQQPNGLLVSDPGVYWGDSGGGAQPTDPSGGTGIGPGMQAYYDSLGRGDGGGGSDQNGWFGEPGSDWGG